MQYIVADQNSPADFTPEVRQRIIKMNPELKRGDIVAIAPKENTYRNDGKAIFDGMDIIHLGGDGPEYDRDIDILDDYGYLPPVFFIGDEFPIMYWASGISHNNIVWIDSAKHKDQLLDMKGEDCLPDGYERYWIYKVTFPLGTYTIMVAKKNDAGDPDLREEYESKVENGEPIPVGAYDDTTVIYPWYRTE